MLHAPDLQLLPADQHRQHLGKRIGGGILRSLLNQIDEQCLLHDIGIHEDALVLAVPTVVLKGSDHLFLIHADHAAVQVVILCVIHLMVQHRNVSAGPDVIIQKGREILLVDHVARRDDHIFLREVLQGMQVVQIV